MAVPRFLLAAIAFLTALASVPAGAQAVPFFINADGAQEVPPVVTAGYATGTVTYERSTRQLSWSVVYAGLGTAANGAHFHGPAARGVDAGIKIDMGAVSGTAGTISGSGTVQVADEAALLSGLWYVNIHTASNPGGEIRAQLDVIRYDVFLEGAQETPFNQATGGGSGTATVDLLANTITLGITFSGMSGTLTGAHLHGPAARGVAAAIKSGVGTTSPITNVVPYLEGDQADIVNGLWYINLHTAFLPGGELRGQLDAVGRAAKRLLASATGTGSGTIASDPAGIDCGSTCQASFGHGTMVMLTATPAPGSIFAGWGGACSGTSPTCHVTMDLVRSAQATFMAFDPAADDDGDGIPNGVEAAEGRDPFAKDNDVFASARLFAMQQYRDFLGREGDAAGVSGWTDFVTAGTYSRNQVIDAFLQSQEFSGFVSPVVRLYFATFLRVPDYGGLAFNSGLVRAGTITPTQLADFFAASPEFMATYGSLDDTAFVTLLYSNVLSREPDPAGLAGWVGLLQTGFTRGQVLIGFSDSAEFQAAMANEVFVTMMYAGMLRRTPEPSGFSGWVGFLDAATFTRDQVINGFFLSTEYRARFLP